jgi:hypothetical protein
MKVEFTMNDGRITNLELKNGDTIDEDTEGDVNYKH